MKTLKQGCNWLFMSHDVVEVQEMVSFYFIELISYSSIQFQLKELGKINPLWIPGGAILQNGPCFMMRILTVI